MTDAAQTQRLEALGKLTQDFESDNPTPEQEQAQAGEQQAQASAEDGARDWGILMFTVGGLVCMVAPELRPIYTDDRCYAWGQQMQLVGEKYGWNAPSNSPELGLIASTIGFAVPTFMVLRQKIAEARAAKKSIAGGLFWLGRFK